MTESKPTPPVTPGPAQPTEPIPADQGKVVSLIEKLPEQEKVHLIQQAFMAIIKDSSSPAKLDPEVVKLVTATAEKDNEHRFQYLTQKQRDATEIKKRDQDLEVSRHQSRVKFFWPILIASIFVAVGLLTAGIWFIAIGRDAVGVGLVTAVISAGFGYLGGLGTAHFFKSK